jgi:hypothetical protein
VDPSRRGLNPGAGLDARRLVGLLWVDRRPRRVEQAVRAVALVERQQRLQRLRRVVDRGPRIAVALQPARDARDRQLVRVDVVELLPADWRRDLRAGTGAHRPGAEDRLVRRVLVVVDEDPLPALLLPPGGGEDVGAAALELARRGHRGEANGVGVPARLQADVDVESAVAGRLGKADDAELVQERLELRGRHAGLGEARARLRVEVQAQLVGVVGVVGAVRPDVEAQTGEVDRPGDVRDVGRHERSRGRAVDGLDRRRLQPLRRVVGHALLEERRAAGTLGEALHEHRPAAHRAHERFGHRGVVAHDVELRLAALGEQHLARSGDPHLAPGELEHLRVVAGHRPTVPGLGGARHVTGPPGAPQGSTAAAAC